MPDEGPNASNLHETNINQIGLQQDLYNDDASSSMSRASTYAGPFAPQETAHQKSVRDVKERVNSVTGEQFKYIVYYPIFDV